MASIKTPGEWRHQHTTLVANTDTCLRSSERIRHEAAWLGDHTRVRTSRDQSDVRFRLKAGVNNLLRNMIRKQEPPFIHFVAIYSSLTARRGWEAPPGGVRSCRRSWSLTTSRLNRCGGVLPDSRRHLPNLMSLSRYSNHIWKVEWLNNP